MNDNPNDADDNMPMYDMAKFGYKKSRFPLHVLQMKCIIFPLNYQNIHWSLCVIWNPCKVLDAYAYHVVEPTKSLNGEMEKCSGSNM